VQSADPTAEKGPLAWTPVRVPQQLEIYRSDISSQSISFTLSSEIQKKCLLYTSAMFGLTHCLSNAT